MRRRYVRSRVLGSRRYWFLFDEGASVGIVGFTPAVLWRIADRHALGELPANDYGWVKLPADLREVAS